MNDGHFQDYHWSSSSRQQRDRNYENLSVRNELKQFWIVINRLAFISFENEEKILLSVNGINVNLKTVFKNK